MNHHSRDIIVSWNLEAKHLAARKSDDLRKQRSNWVRMRKADHAMWRCLEVSFDHQWSNIKNNDDIVQFIYINLNKS